jgi:hypothetical protein
MGVHVCHVCLYVCVCMRACMRACVCMHACVDACMCECMCVCMCACVCVCEWSAILSLAQRVYLMFHTHTFMLCNVFQFMHAIMHQLRACRVLKPKLLTLTLGRRCRWCHSLACTQDNQLFLLTRTFVGTIRWLVPVQFRGCFFLEWTQGVLQYCADPGLIHCLPAIGYTL